jgi:uncharacterized protein
VREIVEKIAIEFREIYLFLKNNYNSIIIMSAATLFLTLGKYMGVKPGWINAFFYYFILPVLVIIVFLRKNPLDFGLRPGNVRVWIVHVGVASLVSLIVLFIASQDVSIHRYYSKRNLDIVTYTGDFAVKLFAWEFLFRGFMLSGLKEQFNEGSIIIQMVPFTLMHFGKPVLEIFTCIPMGLYFGFVAYRGNSFWPAFLIHLVINISLKVFVNYC